MTSDLETMLRTSLHERAHDVEPTPELWRQVDRKVSRRRALPLFVWTAAGVAAVVTAAVVGPGLVDRVQDGLVIDPARSPSAVESPGEAAPGPVAAAPLTSYVAVADGRLVLRGVDGSESVLWESIEGGVRTLAVRPGSTPDRFTVAAVASIEGMLDLVLVTRDAAGTTATQTFLGGDTDDGSAVPTVAWSPDGSTVATLTLTAGQAELVLSDLEGGTPGDGIPQQRIGLAGVDDPALLRLQDWSTAPSGLGDLAFTAGGTLYAASIERTGGWAVNGIASGTVDLDVAQLDDYVVDVATHPDGRLYRLLAGAGAGSGDAEDAGLGLFLDDEPLAYPELPTADPSGVWMTAVDGGVFVGLGDEALQIHVGEGRTTTLAPSLRGVSYAAWIPVAGDDPGSGPTPAATPTEEAPRADGPLSVSGVTPYAAIDENGRLAVFTDDGGPGEVIISEELWAAEAGVRVMDVSVRPGSSSGEVSGVVLLATEGGPELAWFRAAAGETSTRRMEGPSGLGAGDTEQRDAPTFSPDGRHLAWVEPDDAGGWTLRTVGVEGDGPTDEDAGFGLDIGVERLRVARWTWHEEDAGVARGELSLIGPDTEYVVPVERQGDGALAVGNARRTSPEGRPGDELFDFGARGDEGILLVREGDRVVLWQEAPVELPFADLDLLDLDLDVLEQVSIVTNRATGEAFVVDRAGGVSPLEADAATTYGFDPIR